MLNDLRETTEPTCDASDCDRTLGDPALAFETDWGRREAYECACGAVTVTVARPESSR
ncbi:hypothetical protein EGH21_02120 [Halomicroarcula sp. F13]|uniref:Uncharacterized protein n=1 Tax=Haloarcula rubra TaxID=2487747 RepID=A0AAW4PL28_9EURY|nr:hypothetical protein [Halomicroarcula rubra]MBX0321820.1 hypothetical protein [Halomicroarcula rubra]